MPGLVLSARVMAVDKSVCFYRKKTQIKGKVKFVLSGSKHYG